ncbi:MAG: MFS transporter [Caulobacterales bacterium]
MTETGRTDGRLPWRILLSYSAPQLPLGMLGVAASVYLLPYLASHLGVALAALGGIFFIVRMIDVGVDPVLGQLMDRTRTPFGRYRVWTLVGAPILMLAMYKLFMAPRGIDQTYIIIWVLVYYVGTSIMGLAQTAWGATLATHYDERSRLYGVSTTVGIVGSIAVLAAPVLVGFLGRSDAWAVQSMGWLIIVSTPVMAIVAAWLTPERVRSNAKSDRIDFREYWALIAKPDLLRLFLAQTALTLGPGWMGNLYLFFFKSVLGFSVAQSSLLLGVYIVVGVIGAPLTARAAMRFSKHRTLMFTTSAYSLGLCTVVFIPKGNVWAAVPVMAWCGLMAVGFGLMIQSMTADVADQVRLEQGKERTSLIYAVNSLMAKVAGAISIMVAYPLLQSFGYNPAENAVNTPAAIHNLELTYILGPIFFVMLGGACVIGWTLNAARHAVIRRELEAMDGAHAEAGG